MEEITFVHGAMCRCGGGGVEWGAGRGNLASPGEERTWRREGTARSPHYAGSRIQAQHCDGGAVIRAARPRDTRWERHEKTLAPLVRTLVADPARHMYSTSCSQRCGANGRRRELTQPPVIHRAGVPCHTYGRGPRHKLCNTAECLVAVSAPRATGRGHRHVA